MEKIGLPGRAVHEPQARADGQGAGEGRRVRRHDPERRTRILDAALDVLVTDGAAGITHRKVAARADVPLGSVTYHFSSLAELQAQAFAWYVEQRTAEFEGLFTHVATREDLIEVLVDLVQGGPSRRRSAVLGFELHLAALRNPALRALTQQWTTDSRAVLARFTGTEIAGHLDALLEGLIMHALLATEPEPRRVTRAAIVQALAPVTGWGERPRPRPSTRGGARPRLP
ncbi:TetR/AcrR family transcriptional regulator [Streptomyces cynarae]|uniref:TetR/AcrR family transcriptional regulator n=1 Tax=Streptomyces cynarae TaxID=2981134 RepID=UPI00406CADF3